MKTEKWTNHLDLITDSFIREFDGLPHERLNSKPDKNTWSIAENMEHLIRVNESYYPVIQAAKENGYRIPFTGRIGFLVDFFGKTILNSVHPDRRKKIKTFPVWEPRSDHSEPGILNRFVQHQAMLREVIGSSHNLLEKGTIISSPANRHIVYRLETAFDIIVTHEQRHFEQARELLQQV